jgi:hypothetical protein
MPKASKDTATKGDDYGAVLDRAEDIAGYTVNFPGGLGRERALQGPARRSGTYH